MSLIGKKVVFLAKNNKHYEGKIVEKFKSTKKELARVPDPKGGVTEIKTTFVVDFYHVEMIPKKDELRQVESKNIIKIKE